ncbi:3-oxoadipate enol-lactonase [Polynucleobacter sp. AP-Latsch-80-C2]|jgi:3-oxoadipate enol-lactonase|uniref:3-oxoadipate enol-lactonase n=1 Tax=Polynucleobacter sp. AP-Latsch-80-C2 TaxID=2576931 RepID=UPI001C0E39E7|nr:3-oxoadipate enol-lactonase [Polynucleobacter sp. AP-Latsch-80-C2]MBU3623895.1 3-oxoadipate enol-lactonase [Polynucleobacter sp. AP-Latsch-80-C2]
MSIAHINGIDVFYLTDGDPHKPVIIFSNSLGTDHSMWDGQLEILRRDFYLIRYDTRGHGLTATPKGPYTIEQLANDVLGLLDYLSIDKAMFCGISMGGLIGQWLAIHAPQRIEALVIANTAPKIGTEAAWIERAALVRKQGLSIIAESAPSRWFSPEFFGLYPKAVNELLVNLKNMNPEGYASCCEALAVEDLRESISKITIPTLNISGTKDPVTTLSDAQYIQSQIQHSQLSEISASHISNIEAEDEFNNVLKKFFANLPKKELEIQNHESN